MEFDVKQFDVKKFDAILARGLCRGIGKRDGQMCIEAAICAVLDLPYNDDPQCVAPAVRSFKIALNDKKWSSPEARAKGLRDLGLAQLGSKGVVDSKEFVKLLAEKLIRKLLPKLLREKFAANPKIQAAALRCELEGTRDAALAARDILRLAADAAYAAYVAANAANAAYAASTAANAADAAYACAAACAACAADAIAADAYLMLAADLALEVLKELKSPGVDLL